jgi:hypothetical protein
MDVNLQHSTRYVPTYRLSRVAADSDAHLNSAANDNPVDAEKLAATLAERSKKQDLLGNMPLIVLSRGKSSEQVAVLGTNFTASANSVTAWNISQENKMMAHEGQWRGLGLANAPTGCPLFGRIPCSTTALTRSSL